MAGAFLCLALTHGLLLYFLGCLLAGLGFTLSGDRAGHLSSGAAVRAAVFCRSGSISPSAGLGGVAGPILYLLVADDRRRIGATYWLVIAGDRGRWRGLFSAVLVDAKTDVRARRAKDPAHHARGMERAKAALKTPQFAVLAAAYSIFLFVGITVNAVSVAHLMRHGVAARWPAA